jgi:hypothetical protein
MNVSAVAYRSEEEAGGRQKSLTMRVLRHAENALGVGSVAEFAAGVRAMTQIQMRFKGWSENGPLWKILYELKRMKLV